MFKKNKSENSKETAQSVAHCAGLGCHAAIAAMLLLASITYFESDLV